MVKLENDNEQVAQNGAALLSEADKHYPGKG
jgi:hypothetical protein